MPKVPTLIGSIKYRSIASAGEQFRQLNLGRSQVGEAIGEALKLSPTKGLLLAKGILTTAKSRTRLEAEARQLISWARDAGSDERRLVTRAFLHTKRPLMLVDAISEMTRRQAHSFILDYFKAGGDMKTIVQGLSLARGVLRRRRRSDVLKDLLDAAIAAGQTLEDIVEPALAQPGQEEREEVLVTLQELGHSALDILKAAAKKGLGALATAFTIVLEWFGEYRPLTPDERKAVRKIFGTSVEVDKVRIAVMSPPVDLIEWANKERPFTTMYLINFASWARVDIPTLIHELTHVWQSVVAGPFYMIEALEAQLRGEGYNYGYTNAYNGDGSEAALNDARGNFDEFNREQQAMIIQHYHVRRYEEKPTSDYTAWQPYADVVHA